MIDGMATETGEDFVIWGSGSPLRQFVYSIDLGKLFVWALRSVSSHVAFLHIAIK